jgi:small-conductance mechanosensitive channel
MGTLLREITSLSLATKLASAALGLLLIHTAFRVLEKTLPRHFGQADARYRVRKFVVLSGYVIAIVFLLVLFVDRLTRLSLAFGVAGAGLVVALQDVIASFAGWCGIGFLRLYTVGDRIQLGETRGDVIDVSILRTTIMETGNWVSGDLYNGRVARIPNAFVLKGPVWNYSQGFRFVWDEIKVPVTTYSDHVLAREMLLRVADETVADLLEKADSAWKKVTDDFQIAASRLEPTVSLAVSAGVLEFTLSYIVDYAKRTAMKDKLYTRIVEEITKSNGRLNWASSSASASGSSINTVAQTQQMP